tara:strand:- start:652 stop:849 length:198 start_codon:yes stop_codon:yes gene_type:complete
MLLSAIWRSSVKVGDLVGTTSDNETYLALVICADEYETLIKWLDDGIVEDANNYTLSLEVISESR